MHGWPVAEKKHRDLLLEKRFEIARSIATAIASCRQKADIPLRWPLAEAKMASESTEVLSALEHLSGIVELLSNVRSVKSAKPPKTTVKVSINKAKVGEKFRRDSPAAMTALDAAAPHDIADWLSSDKTELLLGEGKFAISRDMVSVEESAEGFAIAQFDSGKVFLKTEIKKELYEEAMVREVARRVQLMRKEKKLVESDSISLHIETPDKELLSIVKRHENELASQVNASSVLFSAPHSGAFRKEWEIEESKVELAIEKSEKK